MIPKNLNEEFQLVLVAVASEKVRSRQISQKSIKDSFLFQIKVRLQLDYTSFIDLPKIPWCSRPWYEPNFSSKMLIYWPWL